MDLKELAGNAAGTIVVLLLLAAALVVAALAIAMIPVMVFVAPMTLAAIGIVFLVAWIRRRRDRR